MSETKFLRLMGLSPVEEKDMTPRSKRDIKCLVVINAMKSNKAEKRTDNADGKCERVCDRGI